MTTFVRRAVLELRPFGGWLRGGHRPASSHLPLRGARRQAPAAVAAAHPDLRQKVAVAIAAEDQGRISTGFLAVNGRGEAQNGLLAIDAPKQHHSVAGLGLYLILPGWELFVVHLEGEGEIHKQLPAGQRSEENT